MPLYAAGSNSKGQLGQGNCEDSLHFLPVHGLDAVQLTQLDGGANHSLILSVSGKVYGVGDNSMKQLGLPDAQYLDFVELELPLCSSVFAGWNTSFAVDLQQRLWVVGSNQNGVGGCGNVKLIKKWTMLDLRGVSKICSGPTATLILLERGFLYACGKDKYCVPRSASRAGSILMPILISENVQDCAVGHYHSVILRNGHVQVCGRNNHGQLGQISIKVSQDYVPVPLTEIVNLAADRVVNIHSGWSTISCKTSSGRNFIWGRRDHFQTGSSSEELICEDKSKTIAQSFGSEHCLAVTADRRLLCWGWNEHGNCGTGTTDTVEVPKIIPRMENVLVIGCGGGHSLVFLNTLSNSKELEPSTKMPASDH